LPNEILLLTPGIKVYLPVSRSPFWTATNIFVIFRDCFTSKKAIQQARIEIPFNIESRIIGHLPLIDLQRYALNRDRYFRISKAIPYEQLASNFPEEEI
jgi:hypothetical protein